MVIGWRRIHIRFFSYRLDRFHKPHFCKTEMNSCLLWILILANFHSALLTMQWLSLYIE